MRTSIIVSLCLGLVVGTLLFLGSDHTKTNSKTLLRVKNDKNTDQKSHSRLGEWNYWAYNNEQVMQNGLTERQQWYKQKVQYHSNMTPCLHKRYYQMLAMIYSDLAAVLEDDNADTDTDTGAAN